MGMKSIANKADYYTFKNEIPLPNIKSSEHMLLLSCKLH